MRAETQMKDAPIVSAIMPVFNSSPYIRQALDSVLGQTLREIEVICVDDGSSDGSDSIVEEYASKDPRVRLVRQEHRGAGAARNSGMGLAAGEFVHFIDSDDWIEPHAYRTISDKMAASGVDVCIFQKYTYDNETGESTPVCRAFRTDDYVTDFASNPSFFIHSPVVPWNKLIRRGLIVDNRLRYDEIPCANDRSFYFALLTCAGGIMVTREPLIHYRVNNVKSLVGDTRSIHYDAHFRAFESTMSYYSSADASIRRMVIDEAMVDMLRFYDRARVRYKPRIYGQLHDFLCKVDFSAFGDDGPVYSWWKRVMYIRSHPHGFWWMFARAHAPRLGRGAGRRAAPNAAVRDDVVLSLTSYPARIGSVHVAVRSLLDQTVRPGRTILWLAEGQFPNREGDLPKELVALTKRGLEIRFCKDDLKPHKKYFYTMQEFPGSIVITVDDDLIYDSDVVEVLLRSYDRFPSAVSAMRVHRMAFVNGKVAPYEGWWFNDDSLYRCPSMQAVATGVGGVLYPPGSIPAEAFDADAITSTCLAGDDLWLKAHEVVNGVPVVLAAPSRPLRYVDGTQESALWLRNKNESVNDEYLKGISDLFSSRGWADPGGAIAESFMESGVRVSFLFDCSGRSRIEVEDFLGKMPAWGEIVCYDVEKGGAFDELLEKGWWDPRLLVLSASGHRTPLFSVAGCCHGQSVVLVDPGAYRYRESFFDAVAEASMLEGRIVTDDARMAESTGSVKPDGFAFDPYATVLRRSEVLSGRFYHMADALSTFAVAGHSGLDVPEDAVDAPMDAGMYSAPILRSVAAGLVAGGSRSVSSASEVLRVYGVLTDRIANLEAGSAYGSNPGSALRRVCPVCGSSFEHMLPSGIRLRDEAECPVCGSMERHRAVEALMKYAKRPADGRPDTLYVNVSDRMIEHLVLRGIDFVGLDRVGALASSYDAIVVCHQLQKVKGRGEALDTLRSKLKSSGVLYLTVPLKKSDGRIDVVEGTGMDVFELMDEISEHGFRPELRWTREVFSPETVEMFSLGTEAVIVCETTAV